MEPINNKQVAPNKSRKQHLTNKELYGKIPNITSSILEQRLRFAGYSWRSKNELTSHLLLRQHLMEKDLLEVHRSTGRRYKLQPGRITHYDER